MAKANFSETIGMLYETCRSEEAWGPTLGAISALLDSDRVVAAVETPNRGPPIVRAFPPEPHPVAPSTPGVHEIAPLLAALRAAPPCEEIAQGSMIFAGGALRCTRLYADGVGPNIIGGHVQSHALPDEWDAGALFSTRPPGAEPFGEREMTTLRALLPHLARALRLRARFDAVCTHEADLREALNRAPWPTLLLDAHARVVFTNAEAERVLRCADGLRVRRGALAADTTDDDRRLGALVARAAAPDGLRRGGALLVRRARADRPLSVLVVPLGRRDVACAGRALVFLSDPDNGGGASAEQLRAYFDLTPSEAVVAREIGRGEGVASVAATIGVGAATVKTHLLHVFAKTGVTRQAELARLVCRLPWTE